MVLSLVSSLIESICWPLRLLRGQPNKSFLDLPPEITDLIAQELNPTTLRSLSLVSRALRPTGQRIIFKSIRFHIPFRGTLEPDKDGPRRFLVRLHTILNENPILRTYVQDIRFFQIEYDSIRILSSKRSSHATWMIDNGVILADILDDLATSPIHTVYIVNAPDSVRLDWNRLNTRVQNGLLHILNKSTMQCLNLIGVSIPRTLLFHCGNLYHFQCKQLEWATTDNLPPTTRHPHRPSSLRIIFTPDQKFADLRSLGPETGIDLQEVEFLHIELYPSTGTHPPFLSLPKLKGVVICVTFPNLPAPHTLTLNQPNLRRISFSLRLSLLRSQAFSWISTVLSHLPGSHPYLQTLTIAVDIPYVLSNYTDIESIQVISAPLARLHRESPSVKEIWFLMKVPPEIMKVSSDIVVLRDFVSRKITWKGCEDVCRCEITIRELVL